VDDLELIRRAQTGDEEALSRLYREYAPIAFKTVFLLVGNRHLAEDIIQETFIQVVRKINGLRDPARFRPWFFQVLTNSAKATYRRRNRHQWLPIDFGVPNESDLATLSPQEHLEASEETGELREAIRRLKPAHRTALVLHYFNGLPEHEIARVTGCPVGTVKSRLYHARKALEQALSQRNFNEVSTTGKSPINMTAKSGRVTTHDR